MSYLLWPFAVYFGIGVVWLSVVLVLARSQYQYVSPKESAIHILAWPFVFVEMKLWWVVITAAAVVVGVTAFTAFDGSDRWPMTASSAGKIYP
jgi:hypothetical protein